MPRLLQYNGRGSLSILIREFFFLPSSQASTERERKKIKERKRENVLHLHPSRLPWLANRFHTQYFCIYSPIYIPFIFLYTQLTYIIPTHLLFSLLYFIYSSNTFTFIAYSHVLTYFQRCTGKQREREREREGLAICSVFLPLCMFLL